MRPLLVDQVVCGGLIKGVIKAEDLVVQVLGEVHLLLWLMNQQGTVSRYRHHIYLLSSDLWKTQESQSQPTMAIISYSVIHLFHDQKILLTGCEMSLLVYLCC